MEKWIPIIIISLLSILLIVYLVVYFRDKKVLDKEAAGKRKDSNAALQLRLQAYERLVLLADRIALPNLISRLNMAGVSAKEMQLLLIQTTRQEFEHNTTQQIYVSTEAWEAIKNLKEQNMLIINQVSSFLPENASGSDLNKALMELLVQNPQASLHGIVSEALSYEAKNLLK
ncbi:MAG: hypothetical protein H7Y03_15140 [Chitinophagaceae bacterium]|nr:hypothetical protein [Chitinophagaceae bacterium]